MDCSRNIFSGKWRVTFELDEIPTLEGLQNKDLRIIAKQWKEKRSLNANSYFHKLVNEIANTLDSSMTEVKNHLMAEYGQLDMNEDGKASTVIIRDDIPWDAIEWLHLRPTTRTKTLDDGRLYRVYLVIRGSSTYDSREMATLIQGTVNEAKELGIETLTPRELAAMNASWKGQNSE